MTVQETTLVSTTLTRRQERLLGHVIGGAIAAGAFFGYPSLSNAGACYIERWPNNAVVDDGVRYVDLSSSNTPGTIGKHINETSSGPLVIGEESSIVWTWRPDMQRFDVSPRVDNVLALGSIIEIQRAQLPRLSDRDFQDVADPWDFPSINPKSIITFEAQIVYRRATPPKIVS